MNYTPRPGYSGDAPIFVLLGAVKVFPVLLALTLPLAYLGIHFASRSQPG